MDLAAISTGNEIALLLLVIMGRWFLPKGNISRSTLSQLLLVYMSLASDIVDLLTLLNEKQVQESSLMSYFTLSIFSWSLFQFSLNLVVTRGRSFQSVNNEGEMDDVVVDPTAENIQNYKESEDSAGDLTRTFVEKLNTFNEFNPKYNQKSSRSKSSKLFKFFRLDLLDSEIWSILITLLFQDGPFLAIRLTAVIRFDVRTFSTMFFTCKNAIILFLQVYRLSAIYTEAKSNNHTNKGNSNNDTSLSDNKANALASLNAAATQLDKFVLLSYAQTLIIKNKKKNRRKSTMTNSNAINQNATLEETERRLLDKPILLRSTLSRNHSYAIVLTSNTNLNVTCCKCECHPKDGTTNAAANFVA